MDIKQAMEKITTHIWVGDFKNILETFSYSFVQADLRQLAQLAHTEYDEFLKLCVKSQLLAAAGLIDKPQDKQFVRACDCIANLIVAASSDAEQKRILFHLLLAFYIDDFC